MRAYAVLGDASPLVIHDPKVELGFEVALHSRDSSTTSLLRLIVLGDALTSAAHDAQVGLRGRVAL